MEKFFQFSNSLNLIDVEELLLSRYSNIEYILGLDFEEGNEIIEKAKEKEIDRMLWDRWLVDYRNMRTDKEFLSFNDYKNKLIPKKSEIVEDTKEDMLKMAQEIEEKLAKKRGE